MRSVGSRTGLLGPKVGPLAQTSPARQTILEFVFVLWVLGQADWSGVPGIVSIGVAYHRKLYRPFYTVVGLVQDLENNVLHITCER